VESDELDYRDSHGGNWFRASGSRAKTGEETADQNGGGVAMLNWQLMKHPSNWVIITLMLVIAGIAGHLALTFFGVSPETGTGKNVPDQVTPSTAPSSLRWDGTFSAVAVR
jgi:hypothetical protein